MTSQLFISRSFMQMSTLYRVNGSSVNGCFIVRMPAIPAQLRVCVRLMPCLLSSRYVCLKKDLSCILYWFISCLLFTSCILLYDHVYFTREIIDQLIQITEQYVACFSLLYACIFILSCLEVWKGDASYPCSTACVCATDALSVVFQTGIKC